MVKIAINWLPLISLIRLLFSFSPASKKSIFLRLPTFIYNYLFQVNFLQLEIQIPTWKTLLQVMIGSLHENKGVICAFCLTLLLDTSTKICCKWYLTIMMDRKFKCYQKCNILTNYFTKFETHLNKHQVFVYEFENELLWYIKDYNYTL